MEQKETTYVIYAPMSLQFNAQGYLEPFEAIATELTTAKEFFTWNEHRKSLWQNFEAFTTELQNILQTNFTIWLNGSFVTQKEIPNDLDLVSFIDYRKYDRIVLDLLEIKQKYRPQKIDSYFVPNYPEKHKKSYLTELDKKDWFLLFSCTKIDIFTGKRYDKGFLELKF